MRRRIKGMRKRSDGTQSRRRRGRRLHVAGRRRVRQRRRGRMVAGVSVGIGRSDVDAFRIVACTVVQIHFVRCSSSSSFSSTASSAIPARWRGGIRSSGGIEGNCFVGLIDSQWGRRLRNDDGSRGRFIVIEENFLVVGP